MRLFVTCNLWYHLTLIYFLLWLLCFSHALATPTCMYNSMDGHAYYEPLIKNILLFYNTDIILSNFSFFKPIESLPICISLASFYHQHASIRFYIITQVILAFWLVLTYDLLEDRCIDDDSAQLNFFLIFLILNLNQSQFFAKHSNQSVRFILYSH